MSESLHICDGVKTALGRGRPVVALESCVVSHGLPLEHRVKTALELEELVGEGGAEPATIAVIGGDVKIGLSKEEIEKLASGEASKLAARDLPYAVARRLDGGTTVSATAHLAAAAGICVMSTGGIGGVHFDVNETGDVSADLWELVATPIVVVCSGPKAISDVAKTAEWLETHGVPIYGWNTEELPAFYSARSGIRIPGVTDEREFAELLRTIRSEFGARYGVVLAVPLPEEHDLDVSVQLQEALRLAKGEHVSGKELTPYLLGKIAELTQGKSLESNLSLLRNNARVAAAVARALYEQAGRRVGFGA